MTDGCPTASRCGKRMGPGTPRLQMRLCLTGRKSFFAPRFGINFGTGGLRHPRGANTPNWDIASTCTFEGERGLLLIEAKAHGSELKPEGKSLRSNASPNSIKNHERIGLAVAEANAELQSATGRQWFISRDDHYQLSNRFAWSWKLASLGIPVVLLYLGFLNAQDMACDGRLFRCEAEWGARPEGVLRGHRRRELLGEDTGYCGRGIDPPDSRGRPTIRAVKRRYCLVRRLGINSAGR